MNYRTFAVGAVVALAVAMTSAQTKMNLSGRCGKPDVQYSVPVLDQLGHMYTLAQGKCTAMGDVNGTTAKDGIFSEHGDVTANQVKNWGIFVETFANGDKVTYSYQTTGTMNNGAFEAGTNKYQIVDGTGTMKGIKGSGTCKLTGNNDNLDYECTGEYSVAGGAPAKTY